MRESIYRWVRWIPWALLALLGLVLAGGLGTETGRELQEGVPAAVVIGNLILRTLPLVMLLLALGLLFLLGWRYREELRGPRLLREPER